MPLTPIPSLQQIATAAEQLAVSNWTARTTPYAGTAINSVTYSPTLGLWIHCGAGVGNMYSSPDAITWTQRTAVNEDMYDGAWGGGKFVVVGGNTGATPTSRIQTSPDGVTWTNQAPGGAPSGPFGRVIWTGTSYLVVGGAAATRRSLDGVTWNVVDAAQGANLLASGNGIVVRDIAGAGNAIAVSKDDGLTWSTVSVPLTNLWRDACWTGQLWIVVGPNGIITSPDAATWTAANVAPNLNRIGWNGYRALAIGNAGAVWSSGDGVTWVDHSKGIGSAGNMNDVGAGAGFWTAVGTATVIRTSLRIDY